MRCAVRTRALIGSICVASLLTASSLSAQHEAAEGKPVLWRDPGPLESRDLFWGRGSQARAPQPPFKFVEENLKGTVAKIVVQDGQGATWDVKLAGEETHPEVITNRLLWALGYPVQEMYFLHEGTVTGAKDLKRAAPFVKDGHFVAARFRLRDPAVTESGGWSFASNPFVGRPELSGLIILMALVNNWDTADTTNKEILTVKAPNTVERWYIVQDLGASFGRFKGPQGTPIKWSLADYQKDPLIARTEGDSIILDYQAYGTPPVKIPTEHARWFANLVGRLSDVQIRAAFAAGGATPGEVEGFSRKFAAKVAELRNAAGASERAQ
jgi:hypothetical protein